MKKKNRSQFYENVNMYTNLVLNIFIIFSGKTTVLYKIKLNETVSTIPTIGFNVETVTPVKGLQFTVWDIGGQSKIRPLWKRYTENCEGKAIYDHLRSPC